MLCTDWARVDRNSAKEFCGWARAAMRFRAAVRFRAHSVHGWVGAAKRQAIPERPRSRIRAQLDPQDPRLNAATAGDSDVSLAY
eukprot:COSAG01_NODE_43932_length_424_cov_1.692308_1_plen_84_part_00